MNSANQGGYPIGLLQAVAIAFAEGSGNNVIEGIQAIASSIKNRINESGTSLNDPNCVLHTSYGKNGKPGGSMVGNYNVLNGKGKGGEAYILVIINIMQNIVSPIMSGISDFNRRLTLFLYDYFSC